MAGVSSAARGSVADAVRATAFGSSRASPSGSVGRSGNRLQVCFRTFSTGGGGGGGVGSTGGGGGGGGGGSRWGGGVLWLAYLSALEKQPLVTKALSAAVLNGLGDVIAQRVFEKDQFNWRRLGVFTFLGLALIGPALHTWYGQLGRIVTATGTKGALLRMAADQLLFAPAFISVIVASIMTLEGHAAQAPAKLKSDLFTMVRSNWVLWVPFQFLNFRFVPVNLQVLASNMCALAWNVYMSWISHS